jgi:hypothetical protein
MSYGYSGLPLLGIMVVLKMLGGRDIMGNDDKGFF